MNKVTRRDFIKKTTITASALGAAAVSAAKAEDTAVCQINIKARETLE